MSRRLSDTLTIDDLKTMADVRRDIWMNGFRGFLYGSCGGYFVHVLKEQIEERKQHQDGTLLKRAASEKAAATVTKATAAAATSSSSSSSSSSKQAAVAAAAAAEAAARRVTATNKLFQAVLIGGALGSFVMATTAGKNSVHRLHPIFQAGKKNNVTSTADEKADSSNNDNVNRTQAEGRPSVTSESRYHKSLLRAKEREDELFGLVLQSRRTLILNNNNNDTNTDESIPEIDPKTERLLERERSRILRRMNSSITSPTNNNGERWL